MPIHQQQNLCCQIKSILFLFIITATIGNNTAHAVDTSYISPTYVKAITNPYEEYNDVNPSWSSNGKYISYERYDPNSHKIILSDKSGKRIQTVISKAKTESELDSLFSTEETTKSYNTGISWAPNSDEFVFISSGNSNNFDLFIGRVGTERTRRLTFHALTDNQAKWSTVNNNITFISAREGYASLYMINAKSGKNTRLLSKKYNPLHPVWSPDGNKIALMIRTKDEYQIYLITDLKNPESSLTLISENSHHNIRPSWSPDGKYLAYFSFNKNNTWNIKTKKVTTIHEDQDLANKEGEKTVAYNVIQNSNEGPTWLPDSKNIAYIKNATHIYNPIYIVNTESKKQSLFLTNTTMNFDLSCSTDGILAFQTQDRQWTRIYIAGIPGFKG